MPRFFFDTYDGGLFIPDEQGLELESIEAAKLEAERALWEMEWDKPPDGNHALSSSA